VAAPQQKVFVASGTGPARVLVFSLARRPNRLQAKNLRVSRLFTIANPMNCQEMEKK
jgi:hypothetical protein